MIAELTIECGAMAVNNLGVGPRSPRLTDKLYSRGAIEGPGISLGFSYVWPECLVRFVKGDRKRGTVDHWVVQGFTGWGKTDDDGDIWLRWPQEPVTIDGRLRWAEPIDSLDGGVVINGVEYKAAATLPRAKGEPQGVFGLFQYLVEAVTVHGTVS